MRLLLLGLLVAATAHAQTGMITGTVRDAATDETLPGATVLVDGTRLGAAADVNGRFVIRDVPVGAYVVRAWLAGYTPMETTLSVDGALRFDVELHAWCAISCGVDDRPPLVSRQPFVARVAVPWTHVERRTRCDRWHERVDTPWMSTFYQRDAN